MQNTRQQLTLLIGDQSPLIEQVRAKYNPAQFELIAAHVTLCREDEIKDLERVLKNIRSVNYTPPLNINFNPPERFDIGKGLLLPAAAENIAFDNLRAAVLSGLIDSPRKHQPHITLIHPRNATCTDEIFEQVKTHSFPTRLRFDTISLIEQRDGGVWQIVEQFKITSAT